MKYRKITIKKRTVALLLSAIMVFALMPTLNHTIMAAPGTVVYERNYLETPVMNAKTHKDKYFYDTYYKGGTMNIATRFSYGDLLAYDRGIGGLQWTDFAFENKPTLQKIKQTGALNVNIRHTFVNEEHSLNSWDVGGLFTTNQHKTFVAYATSQFDELNNGKFISNPLKVPAGNGKTQIEYSSAGMGSSSYVLGDYEWHALNSTASDKTVLRLNMATGGCGCSDKGEIKNISIGLADLAGPKAEETFISNNPDPLNADRTLSYKTGETVYIHVRFNESIRFSDNTNLHDDITLDLVMYDIDAKQTATTQNEKAKLISLKGEYLTFRYDVGSTLTGSSRAMNHKIEGFGYMKDGSGNNILNYSAGYTNIIIIEDSSSNPKILTSASNSTLAASAEGFFKSASLITDITGNPAYNTGIPAPKKQAAISAVAPTVEKVNINVKNANGYSMITEAGQGNNAFVGAGYSVSFDVLFSKELLVEDYGEQLYPAYYHNYGPVYGMEFTLNIKDGSGNPVKIRNKVTRGGSVNEILYPSNLKVLNNLNNYPGKAMIKSDELKITADMLPISAVPEQIKVTKVELFDLDYNNSVLIQDICGNSYNGVINAEVVPDKQYYLDTQAPTITSSAAVSDVITPMYNPLYPDRFTIPITMGDTAQSGTLASGVYYSTGNTFLTGYFKWEKGSSSAPDISLYYQFSQMQNPPDDGYIYIPLDGRTKTFEQKESQMYLHFQFNERNFSADALIGSKITFTVQDVAGNKTEKTYNIDPSVIISQHDKTPPALTFIDSGADNDGIDYWAAAKLRITDESGIDLAQGAGSVYTNIQCEWNQSPTPSGSSWSALPPDQMISDSDSKNIEIAPKFIDNLFDEFYDGVWYIHVRAMDIYGNWSAPVSRKINVNFGYMPYEIVSNLDNFPSSASASLRLETSSVLTPYYAIVFKNDYGINSEYSHVIYVNNKYNTNIAGLGSGYTIYFANLEPGSGSVIYEGEGILYTGDTSPIPLRAIGAGSFYGETTFEVITGESISVSESGGTVAISNTTGNYEIRGNASVPGSANEGEAPYYIRGNRGKTTSDIYGVTLSYTADPNISISTGGVPAVPSFNRTAPVIRKDISDITFTVSIENKYIPEWGMDDVDFERSFFQLENAISPYTQYYQQKLDGSETIITINADEIDFGNADPTIPVRAFVRIYSKSSGASYTIPSTEYLGLRISTMDVYDFGLERIDTEVTDSRLGTGRTETISRLYSHEEEGETIYDDMSAQTIYLGSETYNNIQSQLHKLYFKMNLPNKNEFPTYYNISILNEDPEAMGKNIIIPIRRNADHNAVIEIEWVTNWTGANNAALDGKLPLFKGRDNYISYQVFAWNGNKTEKRNLLIKEISTRPEITVAVSPANDGNRYQSADLNIQINSGNANCGMYAMYLYDGSAYEKLEETTETKTINKGGDYEAIAVDYAGNVSTYTFTVAHVDSEAPTLTVSSINGSDNNYVVAYNLSDSDMENGFTLAYGYDNAMAERLGLSPDTDNGYTMTGEIVVPPWDEWNSFEYFWRPAEPGAYPFTEIRVAYWGVSSYPYVIEFTMYDVYDPNESENTPHNNMLYLMATDRAGNISGGGDPTSSGVMACQNKKPAIKSLDWYSEGLGATFNTAVYRVNPSSREDKGYAGAGNFAYVASYKGGDDLTVTFCDLQGREYTEEITSPSSEYNGTEFGLYVEISDIEKILVGQDDDEYYEVYRWLWVSAVDSDADLYVKLWYGNSYVALFDEELVPAGTQGVFDGYNYFAVTIGRSDGDGPGGLEQAFYINDFGQTEPVVDVYWYYDEFSSNDPGLNTQTTGFVEASLKANQQIYAVNGTSLTHRFIYGSDRTYTFEYKDTAGRLYSETVNLPINIILPAVVDNSDITPPEYTMKIRDKNSQKDIKGEWNGVPAPGLSSLADLFDIIRWTSGYLINLDIKDASPYKIAAFAGNINALPSGVNFNNISGNAIDGVVLNGTQLTVSKPAKFTVAIVDMANNATFIFIDGDSMYIDATPPAMTYRVEPLPGGNEAVVYVTLTDTESGDPVLTYPGGKQKNNLGEYMIVFDDNIDMQIRFQDAVGNIGSGTVSVTCIDNLPPTHKTPVWTPGNRGSSGTGAFDSSKPPEHKVNTAVTVKVTFNGIMREATIKFAAGFFPEPGLTIDDYAEIAYLGNTATVTFARGADIVMTYTAFNGKSSTVRLTLGDVIDMIPPDITLVSLAGDDETSKKATAIFTADKKVQVSGEGAKWFAAGAEITKTFTECGTYQLQFIDEAGNITTETVEIKNIDINPPVILVDATALNGIKYTKGPVAVKVTMNKKGAMKLGDVSYTISNSPPLKNGKVDTETCEWWIIQVGTNGTYMIEATDLAGNKNYARFTVSCIDSLPPEIYFDYDMITVASGSDPVYVKSLLKDGILIRDNMSDAADITLDFTDPAGLLNITGRHKITYTAIDEAGNITTAERYLKVYDVNEMTVTLNGVKTFPGDSVIVKSVNSAVTLSVKNLPLGDGEPYKAYLRQGRWTAALMKGWSTQLTGTTFSVEHGKIYTLYIVTQNRGTYLTYFWAE